MNLAWPTLRLRYLELAWSCIKCNHIGISYVSASTAFTGVALYASEIKHGIFSAPLKVCPQSISIDVLSSFGACHMQARKS